MEEILVVGLCLPDAQRLYTEVKSLFSAEVKWLKTVDEAVSYLEEKKPKMIMVNRICDWDKAEGLGIIRFVKERKLGVPVVLFSGIEKEQKRALEEGAAASFELDLLIGYLGPARLEQRKGVVEKLKGIFDGYHRC